MRQFIIFLILFFLSLYISAQEIPDCPNAYDLDSNRIGLWTILFDSDWNPQIDLQAMDRAHRIG